MWTKRCDPNGARGGSGELTPDTLDPRTLSRLATDTPARRWVQETYGAALSQPDRATGVLRAAARDSRKLRSRERRALWDVVYALIRHTAATDALGLNPLDAWLDQVDLSELPFYTRAGCTAEVAADLHSTYGSQREQWLEASNQRAPVDLRVHRAPRAQVQARLDASGVETVPFGEWGLRVVGRGNVQGHRTYRDGMIELQDEASQRVVAFIDAAGKRVLDYCAGAGGKALALAAVGAEVSAWDVRRRALDELKRRAKRAQSRITVLDKPLLTYQQVLVDAPCSGSGVWRRHPEFRWRIREGVQGFAELQRQILSAAAHHVEPGGQLIYATCSALAAENEHIIASLEGWEVKRTLRTAPHLEGCDGMFAATLER